MRPIVIPILLLALTSACGTLPQPFRGNPGAEARRLAAPPAYRLAVPAPEEAMLTDNGAGTLAVALATALEGAEVPAVPGTPTPLDWRLLIKAEQDGGNIRPRYVLTDADGRELGVTAGPPVPLRAWGEEQEVTINAVAASAAPLISTMLARADAARRFADPDSMRAGGAPRLRLMPVRGAPGDGNLALTAKLSEFLPREGFQLQDIADGAAFAVEGVVRVARDRESPREDQADIQFIVTRRDGIELGRVAFVNNVPTGSLNGLWGDVAYVIAQTAAPGIKQVISTAGGFSAGGQQAPGSPPNAPAEAAAAPTANPTPNPTPTSRALRPPPVPAR
ncbi:hypothetical protein ACQW02_19575 [Humitalea sp. 24SJ18S-53]|uniref:hypothetical protein n=1 Tax=Humitalea sp. 24SJ18S-53 TaxID=3422307 RepID=UPI003D66B7E6